MSIVFGNYLPKNLLYRIKVLFLRSLNQRLMSGVCSGKSLVDGRWMETKFKKHSF
jgi:hypothetical protein